MYRHALMIGIVAFALAGCKESQEKKEAATTPEQPPPPAEVAEPAPEVAEFWKKANELHSGGKTNELLQALLAGYADPKLESERSGIQRALISTELAMNRLDDAKARFLGSLDNEDAYSASFGLIESHLLQAGRHDELIAWCESLLSKELVERVKTDVVSYLLEARRAQGKLDQVLEYLPGAVESYPEASSKIIVGRVLGSVLRAGDQEQLERVLAFIETRLPATGEFPSMAAEYRVRGAMAGGRLADAEKQFVDHLDTFKDGTASDLARRLLREAMDKNELDLADRVCETVLKRESSGKRLIQEVSRQSLDIAMRRQDPAAAATRLQDLVKREETPSGQLRLLNQVFYYILQNGKRDAQQQALAACEQIKNAVTAEHEKTQMSLMLLDGCFMLEDFDRALALAEAGVPGKDPAWHELLIVKIRAHKAMASGNVEEAVQRFREFMAKIAGAEGEAAKYVDPVSGGNVSKEEVLGLNAARISDLWRQAGNDAKATEASKEARDYYEKALAAVQKDSPEYQRIQKSIADLPVTP